jgi:hypothetical protein
MQKLEVPIGIDRDWQITARDFNQIPITFAGTETLSARVWAGDDQASLFAPTVVFIAAGSGTMKLTVAASQTTGLTVGIYRLQVLSTASGRTFEVADLRLELTHVPGSAIPPAVYGTFQDCLQYAAWMNTLADQKEDTSGFVTQRGRARSWLDDILVSRFKYLSYAPSPGTPGFGAWMMQGWGRDPIPSKWLRDQLASNFLIVRDQTREIVAKKAIAFVCDQQIDGSDENPYTTLASRFHWQAENLVKVYRAEVDLSGDGFADVLINCGATDLR